MELDIFKKYETPPHMTKIRKVLIQLRGMKCEKCGVTVWFDQPINLEIHHIDGDRTNNCLENLQLLCPNCHSYTNNYGSRNYKNKEQIYHSDQEIIEALQKSSTIRQALLSLNMSDAGANYARVQQIIKDYNIQLSKKEIKPKNNICVDCGKFISNTSTRCNICESKSRQTFMVSREELKNLIRTQSFVQIGKKFNVSDNAIRKWCDKYNLPRKVSDIKRYSDEQWEKI